MDAASSEQPTLRSPLTNVLLDVVQNDPVWAKWSQGPLDTWAVREELAINPVI